ncbi:MAG TPA: sulfite exporter TauE/SafE family protein, partial [Sphingomonadales bacterium]|nr:sulfite exporter TauE/SafE family protein [Sphingomonadales bacterium]
METTFALILVLALSGALAGYMAGLLGIGGGIVMVPVLYAAFAKVGMPAEFHMQITVGTSLAIMVPTAFFSGREHNKAGAVDAALLKAWGPAIFLGAILGAAIGSTIGSGALTLFFAVMASLMGIKLLLPLEEKVVATTYPQGLSGCALGGLIGTVSGLMGIGGAT